jgi:hypothetical protein
MVSSHVAAQWPSYHPTVMTNPAEERLPSGRPLAAVLDEVLELLLQLRNGVAGIAVADYRAAAARRSLLQEIDGVQMAAANTRSRRLGIQDTGQRE